MTLFHLDFAIFRSLRCSFNQCLQFLQSHIGECSELDETAALYRKARKRDMDVLEIGLFGDTANPSAAAPFSLRHFCTRA